VHGRLGVYNGGLRIWKVGTHRMLGVWYEVPKEVTDILDEHGWDNVFIYGDITVCPLTMEKPGEMQMVCVEAFKKTAVQEASRRDIHQ